MTDPAQPIEPHGKWKAHLVENIGMGERDLYVIRQPHFGTTRWYATGFTWVEVPNGTMPREAGAMRLTSERWVDEQDGLGSFLQAMLDVAWEAGMRPKGFADHTNEIKATRAHLEDMRALVFDGPKPSAKP